jgi:hypothetical protein
MMDAGILARERGGGQTAEGGQVDG